MTTYDFGKLLSDRVDDAERRYRGISLGPHVRRLYEDFRALNTEKDEVKRNELLKSLFRMLDVRHETTIENSVEKESFYFDFDGDGIFEFYRTGDQPLTALRLTMHHDYIPCYLRRRSAMEESSVVVHLKYMLLIRISELQNVSIMPLMTSVIAYFELRGLKQVKEGDRKCEETFLTGIFKILNLDYKLTEIDSKTRMCVTFPMENRFVLEYYADYEESSHLPDFHLKVHLL